MTPEEYDIAAGHWIERDKEGRKMEPAELKLEIEKYILSKNVCALATGSGDFIRCTPIEYTYHDGAFWMFSEGGLKFRALKENRNICLAVYDRYEGLGHLKGMQISGAAEVVEPFSEEYLKAAEYKKIPVEVLRKLHPAIYLIKVVPAEIDFLNSDFKEREYSSRQTLVF